MDYAKPVSTRRRENRKDELGSQGPCSEPDTAAPDSALADEVRYKLLRLIAENPRISQRDVARELGISLGRANYCLKSLIERGWVKAINFKNSNNKIAYMYLMTPRGIKEKAGVTLRFLHSRIQEYEALRVEIERIRAEAGGING